MRFGFEMNCAYDSRECLRPDVIRAAQLFTTHFRLLRADHASMKRQEVGDTNEREDLSHLGDKEADVSP
jgi:hypothetical protein